jgi:hypothetical protein
VGARAAPVWLTARSSHFVKPQPFSATEEGRRQRTMEIAGVVVKFKVTFEH